MAVNRYYSSTAVDTTLAVGISGSSTSMVVSSVTGFPTSYPYTLAIDYDTSKEELVNVVGASGTTLTVGTTVGVADITGRGVDQGDGYRVAHAAGAVVKHIISGRDVREPQEHIAATTSVHGIADTSALVTASSTTILTNKTITGGSIGGANVSFSGGGTLNLGVSTTTTLSADATYIKSSEVAALSGVTSAIQTQINGKLTTPGSWTTSWTPTWGGTSVNASGATVATAYSQMGKTVNFRINITCGAGSFGSSGVTFTTPSGLTPVANAAGQCISITGTGVRYGGEVLISTAGTITPLATPATAGGASQNITSTTPFNWGTTAQLVISGTYEVA